LRIRNAIDFASLGVALAYSGENENRIWHLALTGVQTYPVYVSAPQGRDLEKTITELAAIATKKSEPLKQDFFKPTYRRQMIAVLTMRALNRLVI
jgi:CO/xanthine dehydrogenase FAD-binding subunit